MNHFSKLTIVLIAFLAIFTSCTKNEDTKNEGLYSNGYFITNEGPFTSGTGTVTFFDEDSNKVHQDIFETVNGRPLGNIVQSIAVSGENAYVIVNNAAKIEVVEMSAFKSVATITGFELPRYLLPITSSKAYVSDWKGVVSIVDLSTNSVKSELPAGTGPETMLKSGKYVYVLNAGGMTLDSTVTVIDFSTDKVVKTIKVFDRPTGAVADASGKIWVMCSGKGFNGWPMPGDTKGHLVRIDPSSLEIDLDFEFPEVAMHPEKLVTNQSASKLFFLYNNGIYTYGTSFAGQSPQRLVEHYNLYALAFDPAKNLVITSDPVDFQQNGWILRYNADNGQKLDSIPAGIIPGNILIK